MKLQEILNAKGSEVFCTSPDATLQEVVQKLVEHNCGSLVVGNRQKVLGIITERDILRACANRQVSLADIRVSQAMSTNLTTGSPSDSVENIMGLMTSKRIRHLPILADGKLAGMISIGDLVKAQHDQLNVENHYLKNYIQG